MPAEFVDPERYIKPIGIVGGRGKLATDNIAAILNQEAQKRYPNGLPTDRREFSAPLMVLNPDGTIADPPRPSLRLLSVVADVGSTCEFFIITAHTPHLSRGKIEEFAGHSSSYLSMVDATLKEISERPNLNKVGVMGYKSTTLLRKIYQDPLEQMNIEYVTISDEQSDRLDGAIDEVVEKGGAIEGLEPEVRLACTNLLYVQGVQAIILACSELPLVLDRLEGIDNHVLINPNQLVAEAAVKRAHDLLQERNYPLLNPTPGAG